jgi:hypothetical protein
LAESRQDLQCCARCRTRQRALEGLKKLSDRERKLVNLHPKNITAAAINAVPQPKFEANCGTSTNKWKEVGSLAIISGGGVGAVGVFDIPKPQTARDELR